MSTPIDPNAPVQQAGETAANFLARQQQYYIPSSGWNQTAANTFLNPIVRNAAPNGFEVR
jgi:hypothetical protein